MILLNHGTNTVSNFEMPTLAKLMKTEILEPYGPNVATAEGAEYRFHVRITAPPFSDSSGVNNVVWNETMRQTEALLNYWARVPPGAIHEHVNALTLAVISLAGFGKRLGTVRDQANHIPPGYNISFLRAISGTTNIMLTILVFPSWLLKISPYAKAQLAHSQLDKYLRQMIRADRAEVENNVRGDTKELHRNLLHMLIRSSYKAGQEEKHQRTAQKDGSTRKHAFTEEEVLGNLFIYLLAGEKLPVENHLQVLTTSSILFVYISRNLYYLLSS
jgi:cytochrome P450